MSLRALVISVLVTALALPGQVAYAQPADRDLDGVADDADSCPDVYGAPPLGCPPQAPPPVTDRDGDGVADGVDACPDQAGPVAGCPEVAAAPAPVVEAPPADPNDEYQQLLRTLPNDYDLAYTFDAPARKKKRENDPGRAAKKIRSLGIAGASLVLVGAVGLIATLSTGAVMTKNAEDELKEMKAAMTPADMVGSAREDAINKGIVGDKVLIGGSAASSGVMALGFVLLIAARSLKKKNYGSTPSSGGSMSDKTRRNLTVYGALLLVYGLIGVGAGAVLAKNDDAKKAKNGKILLGTGAVLGGIGLLMFIPVLVNKFKKSARLNVGPMWVRSGAGAGLRLRF